MRFTFVTSSKPNFSLKISPHYTIMYGLISMHIFWVNHNHLVHSDRLDQFLHKRGKGLLPLKYLGIFTLWGTSHELRILFIQVLYFLQVT